MRLKVEAIVAICVDEEGNEWQIALDDKNPDPQNEIKIGGTIIIPDEHIKKE
jgi:hypothetical protein